MREPIQYFDTSGPLSRGDRSGARSDVQPLVMASYSAEDTPDTLTREQLDLISRSDSSLLITIIREDTILDVERIRLMLELGQIEAKRRLGLEP